MIKSLLTCEKETSTKKFWLLTVISHSFIVKVLPDVRSWGVGAGGSEEAEEVWGGLRRSPGFRGSESLCRFQEVQAVWGGSGVCRSERSGGLKRVRTPEVSVGLRFCWISAVFLGVFAAEDQMCSMLVLLGESPHCNSVTLWLQLTKEWYYILIISSVFQKGGFLLFGLTSEKFKVFKSK